MLHRCLNFILKFPWRHEEISDSDEGPGDEGVSGHESEFQVGDDKTDEERDDNGVVCKEVVIGCRGAARRPPGG